MSYYDLQQWQGPARQGSWDQPAPPSRSGASSVMSRDESVPFTLQFEEVDRAIDNLVKSGKLMAGAGRRESMQMGPVGRPFPEFDSRLGGPSRHHSMDFDPMRSHSASNLQNYYASQRYSTRNSDADQAQQAKRRLAAQRERDLRNYHQEQQYNRNASSQGKSERSVSPSTMNEDERRDLIARQRRALYGDGTDAPTFYEGTSSFGDDHTPRPTNPSVAPSGGRGPSPLAYNSFGIQEHSQASQAEDGTKGTSPNASGTRSRANSNSSPSSNNQNFSLFDASTAAQQSSRTSTSSPGGSPPRTSKTSAAPAPIGTRPAQVANPGVNKRNTPPASSPLSFGFAPSESFQGERASSAASNPQVSGKESMNGGANWGASSGVWGKSNLGNVQASVWG